MPCHGGHSSLVDTASQSPAQPSAWPLPPPFQFPLSKTPLAGKPLFFFIWVITHFFVNLLSRPRCFINRLLYFNVSNVKGLNYQYLHIQSLPSGENADRTLTTLPIFFP